MRKRILALTMCLCLSVSMFGCGNNSKKDEKTTERTATDSKQDNLVDDTSAKLDVLDYVELVDFTNMELTKEVEEVKDEDVQSSVENGVVEITKDDVAVEDGDTTVIDFEGKLDGVAFAGGTAKDYTLVIGSGSFIDGFESGLIGVKKGQTVDLNLTFPESYHQEDLAGKAVVFTVTVKQIQRAPSEITDEWFSANTKYASSSEYQAYIKAELEKAAEEAAQYNLESSALDYVVQNSKIKKYFKSMVEEGELQYENYMKTYATYSGTDLSSFLKAQGISEEQYETTKGEQGISYASAAMVVQAVAKKAGLSEEDEKYQAILNDVAGQYNMDAETLISNYGESLVGNSVMSEYAMEYLAENAKVTTKVVSSEKETSAGNAEEESK